MLIEAFAKVNLTLNILGTRPDGYHELETVMQAALTGAEQGVEATKSMVPKFGKAAVHANVSAGVADQGATAGMIMIRGMADYILQ